VAEKTGTVDKLRPIPHCSTIYHQPLLEVVHPWRLRTLGGRTLYRFLFAFGGDVVVFLFYRKRREMMVCMRSGADDEDDDGVSIGGEFSVEDGVYSPQKVRSLRDRGLWWRWRSHFPFLVICWLLLLLLFCRCRCCR